MKSTKFKYGVGLTNNKETNDFLRCLWSRLAAIFGKLAWFYSPLKIENTIWVGQASVAENILLNIKLNYGRRGCLSSIDFAPEGIFDHNTLWHQLKKCVNEALHPEIYIRQATYKGKLDKNLSFQKKVKENFIIEGDTLTIKVFGFDEEDCFTMFKAQFQHVCNLLSFDTLKYITLSGTLTEEIREKHNLIIKLIDEKNEMVVDEFENNEIYKNLIVSDDIANYINTYLERPYRYEEHFSNFDKCVQFFAQGIRNEELSRIVVGLPEPYAEQAIISYMSALEVITLNDEIPKQCECCGQMRYSIARRVTDLANEAIKEQGVFIKEYYGNRSKYVHTGTLLSSNSYMKRSIPMMSKYSKSGMIEQISRVRDDLKILVKVCIEWHESH